MPLVIRVRMPAAHEPNALPMVPVGTTRDRAVEELCQLFGVLNGRDTDATVVRVLNVVVHTDPRQGIGSSELAGRVHLNRLTALHHLQRLAELGLLSKRDGRYFLQDLDSVLDEMERQAVASIQRARQIAHQLALPHRM